MKSIRIAMIVAVAVLLGVGASTAAGSTHSAKKVTISVASLIPGSTQQAINQFNAQVAEFEKKNPTIKVKPVDYQWTAPTFAAKLAAGTLPTVFEVPFTDARTLGDNGQLANLTPYFKKLPYHKKYNKAVLAEGTDAKGQVIALPKGAYAQALHYNRALFKQAGLNPNKPPTTWAQIRTDARIITQKTGKPGYVEMAKNDNTAGWILTTRRLLARRPDGEGDRHQGQGDPQQQVHGQGAEHAQDDALDRQLDGLQLRPRLERHQPGIRRRSGRHVHQRLGRVHQPRAGLQHQSEDLRRHDDPARQEQDRRRARRRHARSRSPEGEQGPARRGHEVDQLLLRGAARLEEQAIRNAKTLVANKQPVGVPALPLFNKKQYDLANKWIKPYINVPIGQMKPFLNGIFKQKLIPEPEASTQSVYDALNAVVEAVLTNKDHEHLADAPAGERSGAGLDQSGSNTAYSGSA